MQQNNLAKIRWRCHRGMLELDTMLIKFIDTKYRSLSTDEQITFEELLELPDPELFSLLTGSEISTTKKFQQIIKLIKSAHTKISDTA